MVINIKKVIARLGTYCMLTWAKGQHRCVSIYTMVTPSPCVSMTVH